MTRVRSRRVGLLPIAMYSLPTACPVKWTATQERSILRGYSNLAGPSTADPQPSAVKILYLQFLWLPEVIHMWHWLFPPLTSSGDFR